jgi:hypothetical protein
MKKIIQLNLVFLLLFVSVQTDAMSLYFEKPESEIRVGDTVILHAYLDTENVEINGIEGTVKVAGPIAIQNLNVAGSVFSLWPNKPSLTGQEIDFVGGSPSGVFGKKNKVFSIIFRATEIGKINFSVKIADVFLNDGKGTRLAVVGVNETFDVIAAGKEVKNELGDLILNDKTLPNHFKIELGQDINIADGKYFISFYATDDNSGVNRYEVRENNLPAVRSGNTYVLEDQSLKGVVEVKAIDNAGNFRIETLELKEKKSNLILLIGALVIIILAALYFILNLRKNNNP